VRSADFAPDLFPPYFNRCRPSSVKLTECRPPGNPPPTPFNRVGNSGRIGLARAQVAERLPSLRLTAGRLMNLAHDANRRFLDRANLWRASSAPRCCALWHTLLSGDQRALQVDVSLPHSGKSHFSV
jgi:hypothetical protein